MTRVEDILSEAATKIRQEADQLRQTIEQKEAAFENEVGPLRQQLRELDAAIARIEGRPASTPDGRRAPRGHNRNAILNALDRKQGRTASELTEVTGISTATMHATLAKLAKDGLVVKKKTDRGVLHSLK